MSPSNAANSASETLATKLFEAQRNTALDVPAADLVEIDRETALAIQRRTMELLGERAAASKIAFEPSGQAIAAPIYAGMTHLSGADIVLPKRGFIGIEVEVAVKLAKAITPEMASAGIDGIMPAIASFHVGIELVGTRLDDRSAAGPYGQLADNLNTCGYVWSDIPFARGADLDGVEVVLEIDGEPATTTPGKHPFGGVLEPIVAYGRQPLDGVGALDADMLVTTGALTGLIGHDRPARIRAGIKGAELVAFTLRG